MDRFNSAMLLFIPDSSRLTLTFRLPTSISAMLSHLTKMRLDPRKQVLFPSPASVATAGNKKGCPCHRYRARSILVQSTPDINPLQRSGGLLYPLLGV